MALLDFQSALNGATDMVLYNSIRRFVSTRIDSFMEHTLSGTLAIVGSAALIMFTVWIMIQGFLIVTGRSQEGLKGFLFQAFRSYMIILIATGVAWGSTGLVRTLTEGLTDSVSEVMTGDTKAGKCIEADSAFMGCKVDRSLQVMQASMAMVSQIDTANDPVLEDKKSRAGYFIGIGTAGPAVIAGSMILMYKVALSLFVGFGPIFIMCLLFKQTAHLFGKWL